MDHKHLVINFSDESRLQKEIPNLAHCEYKERAWNPLSKVDQNVKGRADLSLVKVINNAKHEEDSHVNNHHAPKGDFAAFAFTLWYLFSIEDKFHFHCAIKVLVGKVPVRAIKQYCCYQLRASIHLPVLFILRVFLKLRIIHRINYRKDIRDKEREDHSYCKRVARPQKNFDKGCQIHEDEQESCTELRPVVYFIQICHFIY